VIGGGRLVVLSERKERALFAGYQRWQVARNPFMAARRMARYSRANSGYKLPNQRRAFQAMNCMGVRIWANKPRMFGGRRWQARRATVASFAV